jgi:hypothetical protein
MISIDDIRARREARRGNAETQEIDADIDRLLGEIRRLRAESAEARAFALAVLDRQFSGNTALLERFDLIINAHRDTK